MTRTTRTIRPDDFEIFAQVPGVSCVARDEELRLFWCTPEFYRIPGKVELADDMIGTTLEDVLPIRAARERGDIARLVMETGVAVSHYQFSADSRVLATIFPLDEEAFGHRGIFAIVKDAPVHERLELHPDIPVLSTPNLSALESLSSRELEVLHYVAVGMTTREIAEKLFRAEKTIEHHVNSIHGKLDTHSRAQLVRWASERGIQTFSDDEWSSIVEGARLIQREQQSLGTGSANT